MAQNNWEDKPGESFFGKEAAGVYILARDTGRILAIKRSDNVMQPRTWGIPGGKMEKGETPEQGAAREVREEIGYKSADFDLLPLTPFKTKDGGFRFNNFLAVVDHEFSPMLDHETEAFKWVDSIGDWPDPAHPGVTFIAKDKPSMDIMRAEQAHCDADAVKNRQEKIWPPTLYHVVHGEMRGDMINPSQANDLDPKPYVYATTNPRELLPYLTPNGTRIANVQLPDSEDFITIIPDREAFLKNNKFGGTIYQFSGDGFEPHPRKETQWVSTAGVKVSEQEIFTKIEGMMGAMQMGLHILFTDGPYTPENCEDVNKLLGTDRKDFPHNLPALIANGTLTYENAIRQKDDPYNIKVSEFLTGEGVSQHQKKPSRPKEPKHKR